MKTWMILVVVGTAWSMSCGGGGEPPKTASTGTPAATSSTPPVESATPPAASSAAASATTPPPEEPPPALVYEGLKITATKGKLKTIEVKADGTIVADGKTIGSFSKNELRDESGTAVYSVAKDGTVGGKDVNKKASFSSSDELQSEDGSKLTVDDKGTVNWMKSNGKNEPAPLKIAGVNAKNRRAAILLVVYLTMSVATKAPAAASVSASATAKPPPKK